MRQDGDVESIVIQLQGTETHREMEYCRIILFGGHELSWFSCYSHFYIHISICGLCCELL